MFKEILDQSSEGSLLLKIETQIEYAIAKL